MSTGGATSRLGIVFDVPNAAQAAQSLNQVAMAVDNVADNAQQAMLRTNAFGQSLSPTQKSSAQLASEITGVNKNLVEFIQRLDRSSDAALKMARSFEMANQAIRQGFARNVAEYQAALEALEGRMASFGTGANRVTFNPLTDTAQTNQLAQANAIDALDQGTRKAAGGFNLLEAAVQGVAGGLAFFAANAVVSAVAGLGQIPFAAARAEDSLAKLQARLRFAFRGSDAAARQGMGSLMGLADDLGMDYNDIAQQYGDMAISGRAMGMSSSQVGGAVESFGRLGMISGANQSQINGAMWQVQQMMNLGTLRFQDYRYMATNMGALDDVLATGAGVSVSQLMSMISNGEVSAQKFFEYLEKGMAELESQAMTAPETIERSGARVANAWTRMLQGMGEAIEASSLIQRMHNLFANAIDSFSQRQFGTQTSEQAVQQFELTNEYGQLRQERRRLLESGQFTTRVAEIDARLAAIETEVGNLAAAGPNARADRLASQGLLADSVGAMANFETPEGYAARRDAEIEAERSRANAAASAAILDLRRATGDEDRNSQLSAYENALGVYAGLNTLQSQRGQVQGQIRQVETGITAANAMGETSRLADLNHALNALTAQLEAMVDPFTQATRTFEASVRHFERYGSRGGDLYGRAYEMDLAQAGSLERPGVDRALQLVLNQEVLGARSQRADAFAQLNAQRQFVLPAVGQGARERARAEIDAEIAALTQTYGDLANTPQVQEMIAARREVLQGQSELEIDMRVANERDRLFQERQRIGALSDTVGNPVARRLRMEELERARLERDTPGLGNLLNDVQDKRAELEIDEAQSARERRRREMLEESDISMGLNRERRIGLELLRLQREAIGSGLEVSREQLELEARRNIETQEQVEREMGWLNTLERSGRRVGEGLENTFFGALRQGFRRGRIEAEDVMWSLVDIALDIGEDIARNLTAPWRRSIAEAGSNFLQSFLSNLGVNIGGGAVGKGGPNASVFVTGSKGSAFGNAFMQGDIVPFAMGGVTASMGYFPMANGGIGSLAEAGAEAILPLARGPDGRLGVQNTGEGGGTQVIINDYRGGDAEQPDVQERRGPDGRRMVEITLRDAQRKNVAAGKTDGAMASRYGARPLVRQA